MLILNNKWTIEKIILKHELLIKKPKPIVYFAN